MIGGRVIEIRHEGNCVRIWVYNPKESEMCVHADPDSGPRLPRMQEEVWWQSGRIYFGGPDPKRGEVSLRKIGYSHSPEACREDTP
ncbi:hypothetical protein P6F26_16945 [Roseibacterium sp. SDUM158017]|uniref:hypothetical protein n=1 Tax=Roseicyclus salinarum TaxID=3036773 RepID=UPI002414E96F|nr:hypothetical protein [Roseibacterium sp. SDUM158017]MDG4650138.1 hypothetical protein [Roseibacterium sp. SDUM158017]